jgi:NAD(P)-dependent dehydrogenase (short-subunit alcohol dehydrogenase family)
MNASYFGRASTVQRTPFVVCRNFRSFPKHELAAEGVRLFITGRGPEIADAARAIGRCAVGVQADVSNLTDLDRLYEQISRDAGRLDVVFANAGGGDMLPLEAITAEHVDRIFGTNVKGLLFTVQKALPLMKEGGSVILTGSTAGRKGTASFSVYSAAKAAVRSLARSWVLERVRLFCDRQFSHLSYWPWSCVGHVHLFSG